MTSFLFRPLISRAMDLLLFSLGTLINLPRLYTNAMRRVFPDESRESVLERLAQEDNPQTVISHIIRAKENPGYGLMPTGMVDIHKTEEMLDSSKQIIEAYQEFESYLHQGAGECVKPWSEELLKALKGRKTGIFNVRREYTLNNIVKESGLSVDIISGLPDEPDGTPFTEMKKNLILRAKQSTNADRAWVVENGSKYKKLAEETEAYHLDCNESSEAPIARVLAVMSLYPS